MSHNTHQNQAGKQSADRGHDSSGRSHETKKEEASKEADTGAAPEQADTKPDTVNPKAKRPDQAER